MVSRIILPVLLGLFILGFGFSDVFALEHVSIPAGTSAPGCELTNQCYLPSTLNIPIGETVTWTNTDSAFHTVTSIDAFGAPDGLFDSGFIDSGNDFSLIFDGIDGPNNPGTYDYFCQLHPWMRGEVIIDGPTPFEQIIAAIQTLQNAITQIGQALQGEIQARIAGDDNLQSQIDTISVPQESILRMESDDTRIFNVDTFFGHGTLSGLEGDVTQFIYKLNVDPSIQPLGVTATLYHNGLPTTFSCEPPLPPVYPPEGITCTSEGILRIHPTDTLNVADHVNFGSSLVGDRKASITISPIP